MDTNAGYPNLAELTFVDQKSMRNFIVSISNRRNSNYSHATTFNVIKWGKLCLSIVIVIKKIRFHVSTNKLQKSYLNLINEKSNLFILFNFKFKLRN